jgi:MFS family permease
MLDLAADAWHSGLMTVTTNALRQRPYVFYLCALICAGFAVQIMSVSIGWQVYDATRDPLFLGYVGLAQFLPALLLVLVTGLAADKFNRRFIMSCCYGLEVLSALGFLYLTYRSDLGILPIFGILVVLGIARAFMNPAADALAPNLLPREALAHGISLSSMQWQLTTITGPVAGGLLYGISPFAAYGTALALLGLAAVFVLLVGHVRQANHAQETNISTLLAGFRFIKSEPIVLGAISLDLFAVLLGGATALMPVFARDILDVGPVGLGLLRSAPGIGAVVVALWLSFNPIKDRAGLYLFICVALFGAFTIVFGVSRYVPLSIAALIVMGGADMVSVYVRETLMQLWTPDNVRGRVNAVNRVFIGASNELGEFRAGVVAALIGATVAVVAGGAGTMAIAAIWSRLFPSLRDARQLDGKKLA